MTKLENTENLGPSRIPIEAYLTITLEKELFMGMVDHHLRDGIVHELENIYE